MEIKNIRSAVVGTGFIGPVHIEALRRLGVKVVALCDLPERVRPAAERLGIERAYSDYDEMLADGDIDVVHITTPNKFHYPMAMKALKFGKHVVCEKPLAMNTKETADIVKESAKSGKVFAVNYNVRFYPAVLQLKSMVQTGELGEIIHVNGSYFQDWLFKDTDYNWRLLPQEGGKLRAVADIGTHWMDTVSFILGSKIVSVYARLGTFHKIRRRPKGEVQTFSNTVVEDLVEYPVKTEDYASVLLEFANKSHGNLAVSQVAAGRKNCIRIEIYGSKKSAAWCSEEPESIWFGNRDNPNEIAIRNTPAFGPSISNFVDYPAGHVEGFPDTFKMCFRAVYQTIAMGKVENPFFATAADGHYEVAICEAIIESNKVNKWIKVLA
ncbi:MAG: Gfo/Idh/MocA family oxidoreductase [Verrucomicrobiae bacterium]|nr:Gfo/Idh/MocA family oxidoreductase [Verrucomicrobiae bacterium]